MSNYIKSTDFASKDALLTGNPLKTIKGTEIDDEFNSIQTAVNTKADANDAQLTGTPTAPTATAGTNTTQIATTAFTTSAINALVTVPSGLISLWSGSVASIPSGWVLCDGNNNTPDLRNRFVVGAGSTYAVDATGGSANAVVVSHTHSLTDPGHKHNIQAKGSNYINTAAVESADNNTGNVVTATTAIQTATTGITIASAGESGTNKNLPPYYALAYIMKT